MWTKVTVFRLNRTGKDKAPKRFVFATLEEARAWVEGHMQNHELAEIVININVWHYPSQGPQDDSK